MTSPEHQSVAFLGFCERAQYVRDGNTNLFKWNVLGLRTILISHIYPLPFNTPWIGLAFPTGLAAPGSDLIFRLVRDNEEEVGTITFSAKAISSDEDGSDGGPRGSLLIIPEYGWTTAFLPLKDIGWLIPEPGNYYVEQVAESGNIRIGTVTFAVVDPMPLTPERIQAIKAEPGASRAVRLEFGCKHCPSKFRTYAALERSQSSEDDGWLWYKDSPDTFECECGRTSMSLEYVRRNLHGILGHRRRHTDEVSFMPMYEKASFETIRTDFSQLLSKHPKEEDLQQFIADNPIILHQFPAELIIPKPKILTKYVADFGIVTPQKELILIELEKTTTKLMKKNGGIAASLSHAFDQAHDWLHEVDEHRLAVLDSLSIARDKVSTIRGVIIAGRDSGYDAQALRKLKGVDFGRLTFLTYDDLLFSLDALIRRVEAV